MKTRLITICCGLVALLMATSCIVSDQVTTLIIKPDGSADVIVTRSNIHFRGNEQKRAEELKAFRNKFNNQEQCGFIVADDGQSALLDRSAFPDTLWTRNETITISLQWTVNT